MSPRSSFAGPVSSPVRTFTMNLWAYICRMISESAVRPMNGVGQRSTVKW